MDGCSALSAGLRLRKQSSRLRAGPVEVADVAPYFLAACIEQDRGGEHGVGPKRARKCRLRIVIGAEPRNLMARQEGLDRCLGAHVLADREHGDVLSRYRQAVERWQFL